MGTAYKDFGLLCHITHFQDIDFNPLRGFEYFAFDLLSLSENGIGLAQVNADIASQIPLHHAGYDIFFLFAILVIDYVLFFFSDFLQDNIFGVLSCNAPELFGFNLYMKHIAQLRVMRYLSGIFQRNLQTVVLHFPVLNHFFFCIADKITGIPVNFNLDIIRFTKMVLTCRKQRIFYCLKQSVFADLFFPLQNIKRFH